VTAVVDPANIIKGRIAEAIIEELLRASGNKVYRFGYESTLQNLVQTSSEFDRKTKNGQRVSSMPDFIVINADGSPFFVEVKFRSDPNNLKGYSLKRIKKVLARESRPRNDCKAILQDRAAAQFFSRKLPVRTP
jgi:hypothetical protein